MQGISRNQRELPADRASLPVISTGSDQSPHAPGKLPVRLIEPEVEKKGLVLGHKIKSIRDTLRYLLQTVALVLADRTK